MGCGSSFFIDETHPHKSSTTLIRRRRRLPQSEVVIGIEASTLKNRENLQIEESPNSDGWSHVTLVITLLIGVIGALPLIRVVGALCGLDFV
ncbi:hypothetical protein CRG98_010218 [Punica granatum]|uniref:Uncharacterized protein n=1 Tax=Punica granatum TaxID=22663 RepID=A0A2I0KM57_PUNGR|nr:hypothetical protein CRG98_010218 [Punica granatum]